MKFIKENYENFYGKTEQESSYGPPAKVVAMIPDVLPPGDALDLGAGDGRHALFLAQKGFTVKAVDLSEAGLEKLQKLSARQGTAIETEAADLSQWSITGEHDAIVATVVFQHLPTEQALRLLEEMRSHTRPGGVNAVTLFTKTGDRALLDQEEDPGAFYPDDGWLKDFYKDWEIIDQGMVTSTLIGKFRKDGSPMQNVVERILARKPLKSE